MHKVGTIQSLWRYPVKGMAGEALDECHLSVGGLLGDRTWAVQDVRRQEIQSCKFRPDLLRCRARHRLNGRGQPSGTIEVVFPSGEALSTDDPDIHSRLSDILGHQSVLQPLRPLNGNDRFYRRYKADSHTWLEELKATFDREPGEPLPDLDNLPASMQQYVSLPGTFFLVSPFHILTTASLNHMRACNSGADWDIERFRPNLVVDTLPGMEGLVEQSWLGKPLHLGKNQINCTDAAPRCGAVTRAQEALASDKSLLRSIVREADQNLGIYGSIQGEGILRVGDDVYLG